MSLYQVCHSLLSNRGYNLLYDRDYIYDNYELAMERVLEIARDECSFVRVWIVKHYINSSESGIEIYSTDSITQKYEKKFEKVRR